MTWSRRWEERCLQKLGVAACEEIDERVNAFLERPIEGDWPYLWIDATYVNVRQNGRIVPAAAIVAVGVNNDGRREVLGMDIGPSEAETFWTAFVRKLARRGLRGVKLVISDAHEGIKSTVSKVLTASWQRLPRAIYAQCAGPCRQERAARGLSVHRHRLCPGRCRSRPCAMAQGRRPLQPTFPKLARLIHKAKPDVLAFMSFPSTHRAKLHSTNPTERLNGEIRRRTEVSGFLPNGAAIRRLISAILLEQNDERAVRRARYMTLEAIAPISDDPIVELPELSN
jgi:putative transposase